MKFCICFFGVIGRSLNHTIKSIENNIFNVLKSNNIEYDVYIHNNYIETITCPRAQESNCKINNLIYKELNPTRYNETPQEDFDASYNWESIFKNGDMHRDNFESIKNAIRELHSIQQVTRLWKDAPKYDFYLYLRPDLLYTTELDIELILTNIHKNNSIFTPDWGKFLGFNDRIYGGGYETILKIANRIDNIEELIENTRIQYNAELYMKQIISKFKIDVIYIKIKGLRVRANGRIEESNKYLC